MKLARDLLLAAVFGAIMVAYDYEHQARLLAEAHLDRCEALGPQGGTDQALARLHPNWKGSYAFHEKAKP